MFIRQTVSLLFVLLVAFSGSANSRDFSGADYVYTKLLMDKEDGGHLVALYALYGSTNTHPIIYDLLAENLFSYIKKGGSDRELISWYYKVFGEYQSGRYRSIMQESSELSQDKRVKKYNKAAAARLKYDEESYDQGSIDLHKLSKRLETFEKNHPHKPNPKSLGLLSSGDELDKLFQAGGIPDKIQVPKTDLDPIKVEYLKLGLKLNELVFSYNGKYKVMLKRKYEPGWQFLNYLPMRSVKLTKDAVRRDRDLVRAVDLIWSWDFMDFHQASQLVLKHYRNDEEFLDEFMLRLWWGRKNKGGDTGAGLVLLAKTILKSRNPRYFDAMTLLNDDVYNKKMKKVIKRYLEKVQRDDVPQFDVKAYEF